MLSSRLRVRSGEAGASFVSALLAMSAILGFGVVALEAIDSHRGSVERTLDADRVSLAARPISAWKHPT